MARGGSSIFLSLVVIFISILVLVGVLRGLLYWLYPQGAGHIDGFFGHVYVIFLELTDPGNMNQDILSSPVYKVTGILAGLAGVIILSMLIAFITTALDQKLSRLKKGHSRVIEEGHTLILGWSDRVVEILRELIIANESEDDACVVILSEQDKEFMDDYLAVHLPDTKNTRVVTRSGNVSSLVNLEIVSVSTCRSVIALAYADDAAGEAAKSASDTRLIKTILGVMASKSRDNRLRVIAELSYERNRRLAARISTDDVISIDALDILAKVLVQTSRSIGLSVAYNEIMSFDGCEMYFHNGAWNEIGFGQLQFHFPDGVPLGIRRQDGELLLNPPVDTIVAPGDDILILAEDDSTIGYRSQPVAEPRRIPLCDHRLEHKMERELIIGWNAKAPMILKQYADYVLRGSLIDIMVADPNEEIRGQFEALRQSLPELGLSLIEKDPLQTQTLIDARPFDYDNIIILSQGGENADPETTDSQTIIILLLLRGIFESEPDHPRRTKLISEVMNSENLELISKAGVNDFIISNRMVSMLLAQVSEDADIHKVYEDLFQEDGSEIYLKPLSLYYESFPLEASFADLMLLAQQRGEVCLGIKIKTLESDIANNFGVKLIPEKNARFALSRDDCLIVLAEDDT